MLVHIRRGKGYKDRLIPLPDRTLHALRVYWCQHRHPAMLFPNRKGSVETMQRATTHMDKGGAQSAMKKVVAACNIKKKSPFTPFAIHSKVSRCSLICHPSFRTRPQSSPYPGLAWPRQPNHNSPVYTSHYICRKRQSAGC